MKVHLWCPRIDSNSGGIEKYSCFLFSALREQFGENAIAVFAKNDRKADIRGVQRTGKVPARLRTAAFSALVATRALIDRPNLIVSTHLNFGPLARWIKRRTNTPYWLSLHGIEVWNLNREGRQRGLREADLLLPVSSFTRARVSREQGISSQCLRVLPNTFDSEVFNIGPKPKYLLKRYGLSSDQPLILTVGRLAQSEGYKGHDRILRILSEVRAQMSVISEDLPASDVRYLIIGDGDDRPRLEELADDLGVRDLVIYAGKVPGKELNDHYNLCDLFAMPSTGEGFGIVFLEALACGKPVLAGNKDASGDALLNGELGVLVDPDNPVELRDAIVSILLKKHPHPLIYQPEILRQKVIESFGYERFKKTLAAYLNDFFEKK